MRKYQKIVLFLGLWALLGLLGGLFSVLMAGKIAVLPSFTVLVRYRSLGSI